MPSRSCSTNFKSTHGAVNTLTTAKVEYDYEDGSANTIRPTAIIPPAGGSYATAFTYSGDDDALDRPTTVGGDAKAAYEYFGLGGIAAVNYLSSDTPIISSTLATGSSYPCFDQFGRLIEVPWTKVSDSTSLVDLQYGYNRASSRTFRKDLVAGGLTPQKSFDEIYTYDGIQRLIAAARGLLASAPSPLMGDGGGEGDPPRLTTATFGQNWNLDATGNWSAFNQFDAQTGTFSALDQQRTSNAANEITAIGATVGDVWQTPAYDRNGNMTTIPKPADMTAAYAGIWDAWNRLVALYDGLTLVQGNAYDGLARRTKIILAVGNPRRLLHRRLATIPRRQHRRRQHNLLLGPPLHR